MGAANKTSRSVDHQAPLMKALSDYAQETLIVMYRIKLMTIKGSDTK